MKMAGYSENSINSELLNKLVIKATLGNDIRKLPIQNDDITYDDLLLLLQRIFKGKLSASDDVLIKYEDDDGDMITVVDTSDLGFAVQCHRLLKLTLYVNGQPHGPVDASGLKHIKSELRHIRDSTTRLLDQLEPKIPSNVVHDLDGNIGKSSTENAPKTAASVPPPKPPVSDLTSHNREFDPLGQKYRSTSGKQETPERGFGNQQGYLNSNDSRPDTPSSTGSKGLPAQGGVQHHMEHKPSIEENVATIQPSVHQQINAGHPAQVLNGGSTPLPPQPPATHQYGVSAPTPPASHMFQALGGQPTSHESNLNPLAPPAVSQQSMFPQQHQQLSSGYAPPPAPGANQPPPTQQQQFMRGPVPPTPQGIPQQQPQQPQMQQSMPPQPPGPGMGQQQPPHFQQQMQQQPQQLQQQPYGGMSGYPPPPGSQQPVFGQQQQPSQQTMPPTSYPSAGGLPQPPSSTPGPGAPPVGPPPTSYAGATPGANPFARGGGQFPSGQYVRPGFSANY